MNNKEFNIWFTDFCAAYPWAIEFVNKADAAGQGEATLGHWLAVLETHTLSDAKEATRLMLSGVEPEVDQYNRAALPRHVASICGRLVAGRNRVPQPKFEAPANPVQWDSREIVRQLQECAEAGGDVAALAARLMPLDDDDQPKYRCLTCKDTGMVTCWHPDSMKLAAQGRLTPGLSCYRTAVVCSCAAGKPFDSLAKGWDFRTKKYTREHNPIYFHPERWLPYRGAKQEHIDELMAFVGQLVPANYERGFDQWNQGEA